MDYVKILGLVAAALTTAANVPQAVKIIKTKSTKSISAATYALLFLGVVLWAIYGFIKDDLPLILANIISAVLAGIILAMKLTAKKDKNEKPEA
jgi:MtN3 and saliva related transmembrane protein